MSKLSFLEEIKREMEIRKDALLREKVQIQTQILNGPARVQEIDALLADIDVEIGGVEAKASPLRPVKEDKPKEK